MQDTFSNLCRNDWDKDIFDEYVTRLAKDLSDEIDNMIMMKILADLEYWQNLLPEELFEIPIIYKKIKCGGNINEES